MVFGILLAFVLSVVDFATEGLFSKANQNKMKFISFAAGVSVAYIFLILLPEIYTRSLEINRLLLLAVLFGFALFHIIEKYIRQNYHGNKLRKEHYLAHSAISFVYFLVVGYILAEVTANNLTDGILLFVPVALHIIIDSLPRRATKNLWVRLFSSSSSVLGASIYLLIDLGPVEDTVLLGVVGGGLLYHVIRESLPKDREGKPMFFITGLLLFTVLILLLWNIGFD